jgi:transposase-like protein
MRTRELARLISALGKLPREQRHAAFTDLASMESRGSSTDVIEAEPRALPECPYCASSNVIRHGRHGDLQRLWCRHCKLTFNTLNGTPLVHQHLRAKWMGRAEALRDELSLRQVSERLHIAQSTVFRWRHRLPAPPQTVQAQALIGIAEADEAYFLRSCEGQRCGIGRASRKRGLSFEQVSALVARDRLGSTANFMPESVSAQKISKVLGAISPADTVSLTDGGIPPSTGRETPQSRASSVNLSAGVLVQGAWHVQKEVAPQNRTGV